jgi:hypothetical protein
MRGTVAAVLTIILSAALAQNSAAQEAICTPCGNTISVKERRYADVQEYRNALRAYDSMRLEITRDCGYYIWYSKAYETALHKYDSVTDGMTYPATAGAGKKPLKRYAGKGLGHVGFDFQGYGPRDGMDTLDAPGGGRMFADRNAAAEEIVPKDGNARAIDLAVSDAFIEMEEYYGIMPGSLVFTGNETKGSLYRWYAPDFTLPVKPSPPSTVEKPVFSPYYDMHYHPRPLAACDRDANPVIGCFSFSAHDFFRTGSEYEVTLLEYAKFPEDLKETVPGHDAWNQRVAQEQAKQ